MSYLKRKMKMEKYYRSTRNNKYVIKVDCPTKKGFVQLSKGKARGMSLISKWVLDEEYEVCSEAFFNKHYNRNEK